MSTAIKERFLSSWDKDLSDIWKHIVPVLPDIRYRSGNDAAATLCTFSKNWRTNRKEIRAIYDAGVEQNEKEREAEERNVENEDKKDSESDETLNSEMGKKNKSTKETQSQRTANGKQYRPASPDRYMLIAPYHRPLSPVRMRSPYNALPHGRPQSSGKRQRPKSSKSRNFSTMAQGQTLSQEQGQNTANQESEHERQLKEELKAHQQRVEELEAQLSEMHTGHDQMEQDIKVLEADKARLVDRVAELNEIKVAHDERELQLKGVTERNSPLKVAQEYELLYNNEWMDAKQALDEYSDFKVKDKDKFEILTSTLTECYQMAVEAYENHRVVLVKLLNDPFAAARHPLKLKKRTSSIENAVDAENGNDDAHQGHAHKQDLSPELEEAVLKYMKIQCDAIDFRHTSRYVIASVFATLHPLLIDHDITKSARIKHFVRGCLQVSWKMLIQEPPMTFNMTQIGGLYDDENMELHPLSEPAHTPNAVVDHYIYPAMFQGDKNMQKALVILAVPEDKQDEL